MATRKLPTRTFPDYDLGDIGLGDGAAPAIKEMAEIWRGWHVTYKSSVTYGFLAQIRDTDIFKRLDALITVIAGWDFVDGEGVALPQPTAENWPELWRKLPDDLLTALSYGFLEAVKGPKVDTPA